MTSLDTGDAVTLDPPDWDEFRGVAHRMIDDLVDQFANVRDGPVWQPITEDARRALQAELPQHGQSADDVYDDYLHHVQPYPRGNQHPRFWGWVNGSGAPMGALADMLASAMNPSVGAFENSAGLVEEQVLLWLREMLGFPDECGAVLTSGCSMSTILGLAVARNARAGIDVRQHGMHDVGPVAMYTSTEAHSSVDKACELLGFGRDSIRRIDTDLDHRIDTGRLASAIARDRSAGVRPLAVIATVGTVNTGAVDDIDAIADICDDAGLWLHVDGAYGAMAWLVDELRPLLSGLQRSDSLAFDLHKWLYLPFDIGCVFVKDADTHRAAFRQDPAYLSSMNGWGRPGTCFADLGIELTRRFRALKAWMCLKHHGVDALAEQIRMNVRLAAHFERSVERTDRLELLATRSLNVVCFRYASPLVEAGALDELNRRLLGELWSSGVAVISDTVLDGQLALRAAITNHRSSIDDVDHTLSTLIEIGDRLVANGHDGGMSTNGNVAASGQA